MKDFKASLSQMAKGSEALMLFFEKVMTWVLLNQRQGKLVVQGIVRLYLGEYHGFRRPGLTSNIIKIRILIRFYFSNEKQNINSGVSYDQ